NLSNGGLQTARSHATWDINFNLNHVTWDDDGGARWGTGQNNIAGFQGHVLRKVSHKLCEWKHEVLIRGAIFLDNFTVDPGAQTQTLRVNRLGINQIWTNRGVAVTRLGAGVRSLVLRAVVIQTNIIGGGHVGDVIPRIFKGDIARRLADDQSDFTFKRQQLSASWALNNSA